MKFQQRVLTAVAVAAVAVGAPPARALVSLEDGADHLFVDGSFEMGYDTNVFSNAQSGGSLTEQGSLGLEFTRHAGWIGVNATASLVYARFESFREQDYVDPKLTAELTKQTGRTKGSLTLSVQREDRADVTVNTRDVSWNYDAALNIEYPVIERYTISGAFDYSRADYLDQLLFTNLSTYTGNLYLYYILDDQRDLFLDYRERYSDEASGTYDVDEAFTAGVSGKIYGPLIGSVQAGYQTRNTYSGPGAGQYDDVTASGKATLNLSRRMTLTGDLTRDFATTAEAQSLESSSAGLTFQDSLTSKASASLRVETGENKFIGTEGLLAPGVQPRVDTFYGVSAAYYYTVNEHLKAFIDYSYYRSYSNVAYADYPRHQVNIGLSSHW